MCRIGEYWTYVYLNYSAQNHAGNVRYGIQIECECLNSLVDMLRESEIDGYLWDEAATGFHEANLRLSWQDNGMHVVETVIETVSDTIVASIGCRGDL